MGKRTKADSLELPRRIHKKGERYYYVQTVMGNRKWIPISGPNDPQILLYQPKPQFRTEDIKKIDQWIDRRLVTVFAGARIRAAKSGREFTLTRDELTRLYLRSGGRCELTNVPLVFGNRNNHDEAPWTPSVDRIDASKGYTFGNCRIVCLAANIAMNKWGERVLWVMLQSMNKSKTERKSIFVENAEALGVINQ